MLKMHPIQRAQPTTQPTNSAMQAKKLAKTHYHYGDILNNIGKHVEAETAYREAIRLDPN